MEVSSSPEKCSICLGQMENRSVIDGCLHAFCFSCLKEWSKVKAVCPLCKHKFTFFMHNIHANDNYDKFVVPQSVTPSPRTNFDQFQSLLHWEHETNRVVDSWMSSRIHEWRERIQQDHENSRAAIVAATSTDVIRRRRKYYREGIQISYVKNNKRVRDISSQFFHENPPQSYRLIPWLKRELVILFGANNMMLVNRMCDLILSALPTLGIKSLDFYNEIKPYFMERTDHFLKEFTSFASSPHDIQTYDRNSRYNQPGRRHSTIDSLSSENEGERPSYRPLLPHFYNSQLPEPPPLAHVRNRISLEKLRTSKLKKLKKSEKSESSQALSECIVISSEKDSSDESAIEFVTFIKPPHLRTPDACIDISSSDDEKPGPSSLHSCIPSTSQRFSLAHTSEDSDDSVKVKLKSVVVPVSISRKATDDLLIDEKRADDSSIALHSQSFLKKHRGDCRSASHHSPRDRSASHHSPRDRSASHHSPRDRSASHHSPRDRSASHHSPRDRSASHHSPRDRSASHHSPRDRSASHHSPRDRSASHHSPRDRSASHHSPRDRSASHHSPRDRSAPHHSPRDRSASHHSPRDRSASHHSPRDNLSQFASRKPLTKVFERKRPLANSDFLRRFSRRWSSSSDDDYATPYIGGAKHTRGSKYTCRRKRKRLRPKAN